MPFPPVYTFIGVPYTVTASIASGAGYRDIYWPISQLVDGSGRTGWRSANTTGAVLIDMGSAKACNFVAVFGHNFDPAQVLSVQMSNNSNMSSPVLSRGVGVKQPSFWLDLRTLAGTPTTARYLQLAWVANSRPASIGELSVGLATGFKGVLSAEPEERVYVPQMRAYLEYGVLTATSPGTLGRSMELTLNLTPEDRVSLDAISAAADASPVSEPGDGTRVVVIPTTHRNDAWLVDWPAHIRYTYDQTRMLRAPLTLTEEIFAAR